MTRDERILHFESWPCPDDGYCRCVIIPKSLRLEYTHNQYLKSIHAHGQEFKDFPEWLVYVGVGRAITDSDDEIVFFDDPTV